MPTSLKLLEEALHSFRHEIGDDAWYFIVMMFGILVLAAWVTICIGGFALSLPLLDNLTIDGAPNKHMLLGFLVLLFGWSSVAIGGPIAAIAIWLRPKAKKQQLSQ